MHGSFELPAGEDTPRHRRSGRSLQELLHKGLKVGVIASGDGHEGHPGHPAYGSKRSNFGALMAVWATELTRESVWKAIRRRRCYATTGSRTFLEFSINGVSMGGEVTLEDPRAKRLLRITAAGEKGIETVEIIKDNAVFHSTTIHADTAELEIPDTEYSRGTDFYYLRVTEVDGNQAWSSPIWVQLPAANIEAFPYQIVRA